MNRVSLPSALMDRNTRRSRVAPAAYSESLMPALRLARSSRLAKRAAQVIQATLVLAIIVMAFAPWQQSVSGSGNVVAFAPLDRQQVMESPIKGRIVRWGDQIYENARVTKNQLIAEIRDLDESYANRLQDQLQNSNQQVQAAREQLQASKQALASAELVVKSLQAQVTAYRTVKEATVASLDAYVEMAQKKVQAEEQQLSEYEAAIPQLQAEFDRTKTLHAEGNIALQKLQEVERKLIESQAKVRRGNAYVEAARSELAGKMREREAKAEKAQVDIDYATASLDKGSVDVAKAQQDLNKAEKDLLEAEVKVARQQSQQITAPFDGIIVQITPNLRTSVLKEGDALCTIVPDTADRAVQLWVNGNDAPLIEPGRHVRLQFEGWPAIQFTGWPSIAVGTFGGQVVSVDATDNGAGKFRILVRNDPESVPWPEGRFLRQGVRTNGWVLLNQVPLWFEMWRQWNGFPPVVSLDSPKDGKQDSDSKSKPPKLPK